MERNSQQVENIPVFILAGGYGTRLSEETQLMPKPMVEIGDIPILLHIMRFYYSFGFDDFVICGGYKVWEIKRFFLNYEFSLHDIEIDHRSTSDLAAHVLNRNGQQERWRVRVLDTGDDAQTGARLARAIDCISELQHVETFALTYGDGLSDVDLFEELRFHREHGCIGTIMGVRPPARFGELSIEADQVVRFSEKNQTSDGRINGGFFFFDAGIRRYLSTEDACILERDPLVRLASDNQLKVFRHDGFWHPMDTLREKRQLQELWSTGKAPWRRSSNFQNEQWLDSAASLKKTQKA